MAANRYIQASTEIAHVTKAEESSLNDNNPWSVQEKLFNSYYKCDQWTPNPWVTGTACSTKPRPYTFWGRVCPQQKLACGSGESGCADTTPVFRQETVSSKSVPQAHDPAVWREQVKLANMNHYCPGNRPAPCCSSDFQFWKPAQSAEQIAYCHNISQGDDGKLQACLCKPWPPHSDMSRSMDIESWFCGGFEH